MKHSYLQAMVSYIITVAIEISMTSCIYSCWMYNRRRLFNKVFLQLRWETLCCHYYKILNPNFLTVVLLNKPLL